MASKEDPVQRAIFQFLCYQYPQAVVFSVPNELASKAGAGYSRQKQSTTIRNIQSNAKKMGMLPGMADLCMLWNGQFFAFEVKAKGNYQQANQKDVQAAVERNGGIYAVVRSVTDVQNVMAAHTVSVPVIGTIS